MYSRVWTLGVGLGVSLSAAACDLAVSGLDAAPVVGAETPADAGSRARDATAPDATSSVVDASAPETAAPDAEIDAVATIDAGDPDACAASGDVASLATTPAITTPLTIDGDLSDWPCDGHVSVSAANAAYVRTGGDPLVADVAARWDAEHVFVAVHVVDPDVGGDDKTDLYLNDSVEIYVTGTASPTGDYDAVTHQYVVDWTGRLVDYGPSHTGAPDDRAAKGLVAKTRRMPDGWAIEASIDADVLGDGAFAAGANIGLDVEINDGDGSNQRGALVASLAPPLASCQCRQVNCCCAKTPDLPWCDSGRIARTTLR